MQVSATLIFLISVAANARRGMMNAASAGEFTEVSTSAYSVLAYLAVGSAGLWAFFRVHNVPLSSAEVRTVPPDSDTEPTALFPARCRYIVYYQLEPFGIWAIRPMLQWFTPYIAARCEPLARLVLIMAASVSAWQKCRERRVVLSSVRRKAKRF